MIAIVDHGLGNLRSVAFACEAVGLDAILTDDAEVVARADGAVLPGVGAFGDAMASLRSRGLDRALRELVEDGRPLLGVCLGLQLLGSWSEEFGRHEGLGIVPGHVVPLAAAPASGTLGRVPVVGWRALHATRSWQGTALDGLHDGEHMYFVHSFHLVPDDPGVVVAVGDHASGTYCAAISTGRVFACQFHPERSGPAGLELYRRAFLDQGSE